MLPEDYLAQVKTLLADKRYAGVYWSDPWLILTKSPLKQDSRQDALRKVKWLEERWAR